jgi:alpha-tubulin suppressor-like RCC1 family protein
MRRSIRLFAFTGILVSAAAPLACNDLLGNIDRVLYIEPSIEPMFDASVEAGRATSEAGSSSFSTVFAGNATACAKRRDGAMYCWGRNKGLQLGRQDADAGNAPVSVAVRVPAFDGADDLGIQLDTICTLKAGKVVCMGSVDAFSTKRALDLAGVVPDGGNVAVPIAIPLSGTATAIAVGGIAACAIVEKRLECWGQNQYGALGLREKDAGPCDANNCPPARLEKIGDVEWVRAGFAYFVAKQIDGGVVSWGAGRQSGAGPEISAEPRMLLNSDVGVKSLRTGATNACFIGSDDAAYCWGDNGQKGVLGNGLKVDLDGSVPYAAVKVNGSTAPKGPLAESLGGSGFACVRDADRNAWCWGNNGFGAFANGNADEPGPLGTSVFLNATSIALGSLFGCTVSPTGVGCWGNNTEGSLGRGTVDTDPHGAPVKVQGLVELQ